jgi:hypothetical protein
MRSIVRIAAAGATVMVAALASAQGPWLGGHQELGYGVKPKKQTIMGLYVNRNLGPNEYGRVVAFTEIRLGYMGWKVSNDIFNSEPCLVLESDGLTTQTAKFTRSQEESERLGIRILRKEKIWLSMDGKVMRQQISQESPKGTYYVDAIFGKDTVELSGNLNGERKDMTMYPVGGTVLFDNFFKPMIKDGKIILPKKEYYVIDPVKMVLEKYTAEVRGRFAGTMMNTKFKGHCIEMVGPEGTQTAYVSEEGDLLRVDLPSNRFLLIEYLPESRDPMAGAPTKVDIRGPGGASGVLGGLKKTGLGGGGG